MIKRHFIFFLFLFAYIYPQDDLALRIITNITDIMSPENSKGVGTQTIVTSSGKTRTFEFEMYTSGKGEKSLMRYSKPAAIRGQAFLMLNNADDIWTYFPRTKRVRKLASHAKKQKVQGSDFTYEDMGSGDTWLTKFNSRYKGNEKFNDTPCWVIELTGIPEEDPPYPKIQIWSRKTDYFPLYIEYFNEKGQKIKSLTMEDIRDIEGYPTAMKMIMVNHEEHSRSIMENIEITYAWEPPDGFFSERNLRQ